MDCSFLSLPVTLNDLLFIIATAILLKSNILENLAYIYILPTTVAVLLLLLLLLLM